MGSLWDVCALTIGFQKLPECKQHLVSFSLECNQHLVSFSLNIKLNKIQHWAGSDRFTYSRKIH